MLRISLRWKILLYTGALLVLLIVAMLVFVDHRAERFVNQNISARFDAARQRIVVGENQRVTGLRLTAQLVASFPGLKGLLDTKDAPTIKDFLDSYQRENKRTDLLIALDNGGKLLARTDSKSAEPIAELAARWVQPAVANGNFSGHLVTPAGFYDAVAVPAAAQGTVFGFVIAGARVDHAYAEELRAASDEDLVIAGDGVLGSTLPERDLPWRTQADWGAAARNAGKMQIVLVAAGSYAALPFFLGDEEPRLLAVILQSRDKLLAPYRSIQIGLVVVGLVAILVGVSASVFLAGSVTAPLPHLVEGTKRVAAGDFDSPLDIRSGDEIGDLAVSFNQMMKGLRERADMQKFVSQGTLEMIQANAAKKSSAGERITLTVFFSDIRGFTILSEKRAPEEVVKMLNACLGLQAGIVQKYAGDIDKFMGDCVLAHFYEPDGAMKATQCAIEIEKALKSFNARLADGEKIEVGIGIVAGEVILGSIGSEDRRDFTAVGSNVNLCSRLCSVAGPGEILLSESAFRALRERVPAEPMQQITVKGFSQPIPVYRINAAGKPLAAAQPSAGHA